MSRISEKLPEECFGTLPSDNSLILIKRGVSGYYEVSLPNSGITSAKEMNEGLGVTIAQAKAMEIGSMFGWEVPGANPDNYDENGKFVFKNEEE